MNGSLKIAHDERLQCKTKRNLRAPNHGVQLIGYSLRLQNCILFNTVWGFTIYFCLYPAAN
jgi:hypothetical protein